MKDDDNPAGEADDLELGSYQAAAKSCRDRVKTMVIECQRTNEKFTDPDFDIEQDLYRRDENLYLSGLGTRSSADDDGRLDQSPGMDSLGRREHPGQDIPANEWQLARHPGSVHRVPWIFGKLLLKEGDRYGEKPVDSGKAAAVPVVRASAQPGNPIVQKDDRDGRNRAKSEPPAAPADDVSAQANNSAKCSSDQGATFVASQFSSADVIQGNGGNCWWMSGVAAICSEHHVTLLKKLCVARNVDCGVYGFVFYRDGEWIETVVDDNLYVSALDWGSFMLVGRDSSGKPRRSWRDSWQTGSDALWFGRCSDDRQFWLPLLEKAYAKVHGDYKALDGGVVGEALKDLTGGVSTWLYTSRIRDTEALWRELSASKTEFVFAANHFRGTVADLRGLTFQHAYCIEDALARPSKDGKSEVRLVRLRNPCGSRDSIGDGVWEGAWSDRSKEWTAYWIDNLAREFGDDGVFYMTFDDMLANFQSLDRCRLLPSEIWKHSSRWIQVRVPWAEAHLRTRFTFTLKSPCEVIIVLSQLDTRYFKGLEGKYGFSLDFIVHVIQADGKRHYVG